MNLSDGDRAEHMVREFLAKASDREPNSIRPDEPLNNLGVDSLDYVEFVMRLEDELFLELSDAEKMRLRTVQDLIDYVRRSLS